MQTPLTRILNLDVPLIQAPMAGVSTPELAAAVSNAGALGSVALGALDAEEARASLRRTRALTDRPIAANVFVHPAPERDAAREQRFLAALAPLFAEHGAEPPAELDEIYLSLNDDPAKLEMLLEERPEAVSLHFGAGAPDQLRALKTQGIRLLATATTVAEARVLEAAGVDGIVLQGDGAGGHSGAFLEPLEPAHPEPAEAALGVDRNHASSGIEPLLRLVRDAAQAVRVPLIAAGGLMDGHDVVRVLAAGAAGAQLGTAFIACPECRASEAYRAALAGGRTAVTGRISGRPARGLVNALMRRLGELRCAVPDYPVAYDAIKQLTAAARDPGFAVMWAGTGAARARAQPAAELVRAIAEAISSGRSAGDGS